MDCYVAELDEKNSISAVWVKSKKTRGPSVYDPKKHIFDPNTPSEFLGAPKDDIVRWLTSKSLKT